MHACCRAKNRSKIWGLVQVFFTVSPFYRVFWACLKTQIVSICAKLAFFFFFCRDVKIEEFEKKIAFFGFVLFMLLQVKQKKEKQDG